MCGLTGMYSLNKPYKVDIDLFHELMWVTALRGMHSTGVFQVYKDGKDHLKKVVGSTASWRMHATKDDWFNDDTRVVMSHHRWATVGAITTENAHPFDTGRYVGAHNGTLKDRSFAHKDKTDSQMMFEMIEKEGIMPVLSRIRAMYSENAFAISIWDRETKRLYLARNYQRPLVIMRPKTYQDFLYYVSEQEAAAFVANRQDIKMGWDFEKLEIDTLYEIGPSTGNAFKVDIKKTHIPMAPRVKLKTQAQKSAVNEWIDDEWSSNKDWGVCADCQELILGDEYKSAARFVQHGKQKMRCVQCHQHLMSA